MPEPFRSLPPNAVVAGYDFSTGGAKALAFDLAGNTLASVRLPTDLCTDYLPTDDPKLFRDSGNRELNLMMLEGQALAATRALAAELEAAGRLKDWQVAGISATHHSAGRVDRHHNQVRRAICWNDQTLAAFHAEGLARLGEDAPKRLTGGPWAVRYSLTHLVKDAHIMPGAKDSVLPRADWERTRWILMHGPLAAGYLTDRWGVTSVSSAASTGIMNLERGEWCREMLDAIPQPDYRELAWNCLPRIIDMNTPVGRIAEHVALAGGLPPGVRPVVYPTLDDQAAGLIGGGAVDPGQVAVILGNSAVVNSSSDTPPAAGTLDVMKLNWGPYLWMRCYSNGAQFLDRVVGPNLSRERWEEITAKAAAVPAGGGVVSVMPFVLAEPSAGVAEPWVEWFPREPAAADEGVRLRASFEAIAYLIARGVKEHEAAGQTVTRISVSGGIARNELMLRILASVLGQEVYPLVSQEGSAFGAAVAAAAGAEASARQRDRVADQFRAADAAAAMVRFKDAVPPVAGWVETYKAGFAEFERRLAAKK